ncbi:MAG: hypothetical protein KBD05_00520 [Candidatus Pacebacteria bacterium]|nr:hypothetical protein [Candidatus Paceibacterota bacterium]
MSRRSRITAREALILGALSLALVWLLWLLWGIVHKEEKARTAADEAKEELTALQVRKETLEENIAELSTSRGEEATLRETYGVARPGEEVIIVVPDDGREKGPPLPWWRKFMGWFGL